MNNSRDFLFEGNQKQYKEFSPDELDKLIHETIDDVQRCVGMIVGKYKFFGEFVYGMRFIYTYSVQTMSTDGKNIFVNPLFAKSLTDKEMIFVICHEILHVLLLHFPRSASHNIDLKIYGKKWNYAADYELNPLLVDEGLLTPDEVNKMGALFDSKWFEKSAEYIYDNLGDIPPDEEPPGAPKDFPAQVGDCVKLYDGTYGVISGITKKGEYEIEPISEDELIKRLGA